MRIASGTTDQVVSFVAVDSTDFTTRKTGLTSFTVYRSRNGGTSTAMTTPTVTEVDATNMPGVYTLLLDEDMTIGTGNITEEMVFHITQASMAPVTRYIELFDAAYFATAASLAAAQSNLTTITGSDGVTLATAQALYAPAKATDIVTGGAITTSGGAVSNVTTVATTTTNTDMRGTDNAATAASLATTDGKVDTINTNAAAVKAVTDLLPDSGALSSLATPADILTTALTESYAADGAEGTLTQMLYLIQQALTEFSISGTTVTTKKLDGTTTAATFNLDSASTPSSTTRAT